MKSIGLTLTQCRSHWHALWLLSSEGPASPGTLTLYLLSPICSTWNRLAHLHLATCLVTCRRQRCDVHVNLATSRWGPRNREALQGAGTPCCNRASDKYLVFDFVSIRDGFVCIFVWMQSGHEFIVVDVPVTISVKDVCHGAHLQATGGKL